MSDTDDQLALVAAAIQAERDLVLAQSQLAAATLTENRWQEAVRTAENARGTAVNALLAYAQQAGRAQ